MSANDRIARGRKEALALAEGQGGTVLVRQVLVPDVDAAKIRRQTDLFQAQFAHSIGVAKGTLLNWEHRPAPIEWSGFSLSA